MWNSVCEIIDLDYKEKQMKITYEAAIQIIDNMFMTVNANGDYDSNTVDNLLIPIKEILVVSKEEHKLLGLYRRKEILGKTVGANKEYLRIHARIKLLEGKMK